MNNEGYDYTEDTSYLNREERRKRGKRSGFKISTKPKPNDNKQKTKSTYTLGGN